jgi:hypothetical protein
VRTLEDNTADEMKHDEKSGRRNRQRGLNLIWRSRVPIWAPRYVRLNLTVSFSTERSHTALSFGRKMIW